MFQLVQENNVMKMKYYEMMNNYNKMKNDSELLNNKNKSEIEHLNKIIAFMKNQNMDLNKTIVDKNKQVLDLIKKNNNNRGFS